jgi:hypothetical protein
MIPHRAAAQKEVRFAASRKSVGLVVSGQVPFDVAIQIRKAAIYQEWIAAGKPAELHLFSRGGHGFGRRQQHLPSDHWIERFADWLDVQGFLKK